VHVSWCLCNKVKTNNKKTSAKCINRSNNAEYCEHQNNVPIFSNFLKTHKKTEKVISYQVFVIIKDKYLIQEFCISISS